MRLGMQSVRHASVTGRDSCQGCSWPVQPTKAAGRLSRPPVSHRACPCFAAMQLCRAGRGRHRRVPPHPALRGARCGPLASHASHCCLHCFAAPAHAMKTYRGLCMLHAWACSHNSLAHALPLTPPTPPSCLSHAVRRQLHHPGREGPGHFGRLRPACARARRPAGRSRQRQRQLRRQGRAGGC